VGRFSAVGYFFARRLHETLKQPIGVIHTSWGGTPRNSGRPRRSSPARLISNRSPKRGQSAVANYPKAKEAYEKALAEWRPAAEQAKAEGKTPPRQPNAPRGGDAFGGPGCLYNGMIAPVLPYTIQGAIWYQGESNASAAALYRKLFPTMILSWRMAWAKAGLAGSDRPDFPFLFVQLANYIPANSDPARSEWAELREAQLQTLELPRTGMAVAIDIGEAGDIHPKNKQEVGRRLALCAEATVYYRDQEYSGPLFGGSQIEEGKMRLSFRNANGMKAKDGGPVKGFTIAGEDRVFHAADAEIQGDHVIVSSKEVPKPVAGALCLGGQSGVQSDQRSGIARLTVPHRRLVLASMSNAAASRLLLGAYSEPASSRPRAARSRKLAGTSVARSCLCRRITGRTSRTFSSCCKFTRTSRFLSAAAAAD
jgi:sialate O-acetylesterase